MPKKAKERKGKKKHTKHKMVRKSEQFVLKGGTAERSRSCPKCGSGIFLANHKDRLSCGKCAYTEWKHPANEPVA